MNFYNIKNAIKELKTRIIERFDSIRVPLNFIKKIDEIEHVPGCVDAVDDAIDIDIKYAKEDFEHLLASLAEGSVPKENIVYKYFLITIRDNDFYSSLHTVGETFLHVLGYEFTYDKFNLDRFKANLPDLICSIFTICQNVKPDYVKKYLKICYTPEEINEFIDVHGMGCYENYVNPLFKDAPEFAESLHCDCNAEALIIKLAYNKENNAYLEEQSEWIVI